MPNDRPASADRLDPDLKLWIDAASYEDLLRRNRFSPAGDPAFQGVTGNYFMDVMNAKRAALPHGEPAVISKRVGWDIR